MGIDIDSKFLVGLWYEDFPEELKEKFESEELIMDDFFGDLDMTYASPYYDSSGKECFYGYRIQDNANVDIVCEQLKTAANMFKTHIGIEPVVYAGCHVW